MLDNICTCVFVIGKFLATLTSTQMIPVCLDGDLVPVKGVAALLSDSSLLPSPHPVSPGYLSLCFCVCGTWLGSLLITCYHMGQLHQERQQDSVCPNLVVRVLIKLFPSIYSDSLATRGVSPFPWFFLLFCFSIWESSKAYFSMIKTLKASKVFLRGKLIPSQLQVYSQGNRLVVFSAGKDH